MKFGREVVNNSKSGNEKSAQTRQFYDFLLDMCIFFGQETTAQKRIVIDVGHGGKDSGTIGINGIKEKDVVLDIGLEILRLNKKSETPLDIYLTGYSDTLISLSDRTKLAKALNADLFISLHCNHSHNPNARGVEVYVASTISQYSKNSTWFAYQLQNQINKHLGFKSRGVKFADFQVLREAVSSNPSILLELGFLTNKDEGNFFSENSNTQAMSLVILRGLNNHLKMLLWKNYL